jgi:hypothetical protein
MPASIHRATTTVIDVHSYPSVRLPYERGGDERPAVCFGADDAHTLRAGSEPPRKLPSKASTGMP